jgi:hypothetical protein
MPFVLHFSVRCAQCLTGVASTLVFDNAILGRIRKDESPLTARSTPSPKSAT